MQSQTETDLDLRKIWQEFKARNPAVRIRDAARELGVSEGELLASETGDDVIRLRDDFAGLLHQLHRLGHVMALTRNEQIVHERKGVYANASTGLPHKMALFVNPDIDLRIFLNNWHHGFAVTTDSPRGVMRSLQFFDCDGTAVHKVFLTEKSDVDAYLELVEEFRNGDQSLGMNVTEKTPPSADRPDDEIDVEGFRDAWSKLQDTHDFFPLLRKFGVGREQALRLAAPEMVKKVPVSKFRELLELASDRKLPIMIFVGNPGIIQIHTGEVEKVLEARGWFNVMDPEFNLHINQSEVASAWIVRKPTTDGVVTSLELFNESGENIALFFGKRKPGVPEMEEWRELIRTLEA